MSPLRNTLAYPDAFFPLNSRIILTISDPKIISSVTLQSSPAGMPVVFISSFFVLAASFPYIHHPIASIIVDLPEPFLPTMPMMPAGNSIISSLYLR